MSQTESGKVVVRDIRSICPSGGSFMISIPKGSKLGLPEDGDSIVLEVRVTNSKLIVHGEIDKPESFDISELLS
jgi:hypothetical protein